MFIVHVLRREDGYVLRALAFDVEGQRTGGQRGHIARW